jgi:hypothetical protein
VADGQDLVAAVHWLVSLDTERGNRNVRRIKIGVGIVREKTQARSSVVEHYLDTVGVGGSIPPVPTSSDGNPGRVPKPSRDELRRAKLASAHAIDGNPLPSMGGNWMPSTEGGPLPSMWGNWMRWIGAFDFVADWLGAGLALAAMLYA